MISGLHGIEAEYDVSTIKRTLASFRDAHIEQYYIAVKEFQTQYIAAARKVSDAISHTEFPEVKADFGLTRPILKDKEYDNMINVFSQIVTPTIKLSMNDANSIFNDDWDFVKHAKFINSTYASSKR
jgi:hypothetical protein